MSLEPAGFVTDLLEAGLTQEQIATRAGVHQTTVSKLARGDTKDVYSRTYRALQSLHTEICRPQPNLETQEVSK
jgi:transcriptional regulator with XRE-family HTH domain